VGLPIPRAARLALVLPAIAICLLVPAVAQATTGVSGTVTGPGALDEVEVCIVEPLPSETCTYPKADGEYQLFGLDAGVYQVEFLPSYRSHLVLQYYNHKAKLSEANKVVVSGGFVTLNVDADLELGGEIEGTVRDELGGAGVESVEACALDVVTGSPVSCSHTDAAGFYALPSVPPGSYRIGFWGQGPSASYAPQYYEESASFFNADPVSVAAGETVTGVDVALHEGARVSGRVIDSATGSPLGGIAVCILAVGASGPERCAYTDGSGGYQLPGLPSGSYQVVFSPEFSEFSKGEFTLPEEDGWRTRYFSGSSDRAGATTLQLSAAEARAGVDAALVPTLVPASPIPPPPAPDVAIAPPPVLPLPVVTRPKKCRKGFQKRQVKGKARCLRVRRKHHRHKRRRHVRQTGQNRG
jgi:hypothetical protein